MKEYSKRFKSQILQELFSTEIPEDWSLIALTLGLSQQPYQCAGYPVGGSLNLAKNIEREAKRLGVTFRYNSTVERIVVEDGVAKGVTLRGGEQVEADYVISAADGHTTLFGMLEGKYLSKPYQRAYESYPLFPPASWSPWASKVIILGTLMKVLPISRNRSHYSMAAAIIDST